MWARMINALLGIWLMAAPAVLGYTGSPRLNDRIVGPLTATFAIVAIWEVTRGLRWVNAGVGVWLLLVPFILRYGSWVPMINSLAVGAAMILLALVPGKVTQRMGEGWSSLWK